MLVARYHRELLREMEIIPKLGEVILEIGRLSGWLLSGKAPHVLLRSACAVCDEFAEWLLHVLEVLALEIHVVVLGLVNGDLAIGQHIYQRALGLVRCITIRSGLTLFRSSSAVHALVHEPMSRFSMIKGLDRFMRRSKSSAVSSLTRRISFVSAGRTAGTLGSSAWPSFSGRKSSCAFVSVTNRWDEELLLPLSGRSIVQIS